MSYAPAFRPTLEDESLDKLGVEGVELRSGGIVDRSFSL